MEDVVFSEFVGPDSVIFAMLVCCAIRAPG